VKGVLLTAFVLAGFTGSGLAQGIGDPAAGAQIFKRCMACHKVGADAKNGVGPVLNGLIGRLAGTYPGYAYSEANSASHLIWDVETLRAYLPNPRAFMPGTKMVFPGIGNEEAVDDVIAFLAQFDEDGHIVDMTVHAR
jgi:cytochrome c